MALPSSGLITAAMINKELGRAETAAFNLNDPVVRALAGKASGVIGFADFYGKSSEIVVTLASGAGPHTMKALFSATDWTSDTTKRVVIPAGVEVGAVNYNHVIAVSPGADGQAGSFGGILILENRGILSGKGGAANGGAGGTAVFANMLGKNGQKLQIYNHGTIRGGGGGGGRGGNGGAGNISSAAREPASGDRGDNNNCLEINFVGGPWYQYKWNGVVVGTGNFQWGAGIPPVTKDGWTYHDSGRTFGGDDTIGWFIQGIYRTGTVYTSTSGGAGGNGGVGQGYGQGLSGGANGSGGGTNAGAGGKGGNGSAYGAAGAVGATGGNGNAGNGAAGAAGGDAGCYIDGEANVTWLVTGTRQGRAI